MLISLLMQKTILQKWLLDFKIQIHKFSSAAGGFLQNCILFDKKILPQKQEINIDQIIFCIVKLSKELKFISLSITVPHYCLMILNIVENLSQKCTPISKYFYILRISFQVFGHIMKKLLLLTKKWLSQEELIFAMEDTMISTIKSMKIVNKFIQESIIIM